MQLNLLTEWKAYSKTLTFRRKKRQLWRREQGLQDRSHMNFGSLKSHLEKDQISSHVQKEIWSFQSFSVLKCPWNILNLYLFSVKSVCTQFRSLDTMSDLRHHCELKIHTNQTKLKAETNTNKARSFNAHFVVDLLPFRTLHTLSTLRQLPAELWEIGAST